VNRCGAVLLHIAGGRNEFGGDVAPRLVCIELFRQGYHQRIGHDRRAVFQPAQQNHIAPVAGPILSVLWFGQQLAYGPLSLVFRRIE
jgi:hypothetical protein